MILPFSIQGTDLRQRTDQIVYQLNRPGVTSAHISVQLAERSSMGLFPWYHLGDQSGYAAWYAGGLVDCAGLTTGTPAVDTILVTPFFVPRTIEVDEIGVDVTVAAGAAEMILGIYDSTSDVGGDLLTLTKLGETGVLTPSATGALTGACSTVLEGGHVYWLAYVTWAAAATIRCLPLGSAYPIMGFPATFGGAPGWGFSATYALPAVQELPDTFPSSTLATGTPVPAIYVHGTGFSSAVDGYRRVVQIMRAPYEGMYVTGASMLKTTDMPSFDPARWVQIELRARKDGETRTFGTYDSRDASVSLDKPYVFHADQAWEHRLALGEIPEVHIQAWGGMERELIDCSLHMELRYIGG